MNKPIYIRDGRRFKRIENYVGMYANTLVSVFTKKRTTNSHFIVVAQNGDELTLASLKHHSVPTNWETAMQTCKSLGAYLPSRSELLSLFDNHRELFEQCTGEWTSTEYSSYNAWRLYWYSSEGVDDDGKRYNYYVRPFYKHKLS